MRGVFFLDEKIKESREQRRLMGSKEDEPCLSRVWGTDRIYLFNGFHRVLWTNSTSSFWDLAKNADSQALPTHQPLWGQGTAIWIWRLWRG